MGLGFNLWRFFMYVRRVHTVVVCGSTRFIEEMKQLETELTWQGFIVIAPTKINLKESNPLWDHPEDLRAGIERLNYMYAAAINNCSWVVVYGDYIGESVRKEVEYALSIDVPVFFTDQKKAEEFGGELYVPWVWPKR